MVQTVLAPTVRLVLSKPKISITIFYVIGTVSLRGLTNNSDSIALSESFYNSCTPVAAAPAPENYREVLRQKRQRRRHNLTLESSQAFAKAIVRGGAFGRP